MLVEVEFCRSIGLIGADGVDLETLFTNLLVVSDTYIYGDVGNGLVVKNGGRYHVFLAHMTWKILVKRAGTGGPSNSRYEIDTVRLMHANWQSLPCSYLPVACIF